jgi:hypothetical protein
VLLTSFGGDKPESPSATEKEQVVSTESAAVELKTDGSVNLLDVFGYYEGSSDECKIELKLSDVDKSFEIVAISFCDGKMLDYDLNSAVEIKGFQIYCEDNSVFKPDVDPDGEILILQDGEKEVTFYKIEDDASGNEGL